MQSLTFIIFYSVRKNRSVKAFPNRTRSRPGGLTLIITQMFPGSKKKKVLRPGSIFMAEVLIVTLAYSANKPCKSKKKKKRRKKLKSIGASKPTTGSLQGKSSQEGSPSGHS